MNFTISKSEFQNALSIVSHAVSSSSPQVTLRGIKIVVADQKMVLCGSNADISIQKTIIANEENKLNIIEEGSLLLDARILLDIVRKIDSNVVSIEIIDGSFTKFSGNQVVFKINGMNANDYPTIDFSRPADSFQISSTLLKDIIEETGFAASTKETRPILTGVNFKYLNDHLVITATDSYRLARKTVEFAGANEFNVTLPAKALNDVKSTMLDGEEVQIDVALSSKKAQFITEDMILQTRLLDGGYPDTDRLVPSSFSAVLTIDRMALIQAIDRSIFIKNDNMAIMRLQCSADEIVLTNRSQEIGESHEALHATYEGEPLDISFSGNYVLDAARSFSSSMIQLKFTGVMRPFILQDDQDSSILQLVLPVRTYN